MVRRAYIALLIAVAAVAVGACGSDDDSASDTSTAAGVIQPQGTTTPPSGTTGPTGAERTGTKPTAKSREREKTRAGESQPGSATPSAPATPEQTPQPHSLTPAELKQVSKQQYEQARILCKASTLEALAKQYGIKNADPDAVAKAYAAPYLVGLRDAVRRGCKAGLREAK
jgi:hypothetical protein